MDPDQLTAMRDLIDHLRAALVLADGLSESLIGALVCQCLEEAERALGGD